MTCGAAPTASRKSGFNKEALEESCKNMGIEYRHCGELGNKKVSIETLMETAEGISALKQLAEKCNNFGETAIVRMCAEHDSKK